ncbi:hypothetical protein E3983_10395 [Legionella israelensis]|uniref:Uncharacterized protein n=1 Tax=Legionella israelensis TaxID=454 RepID=A0AAX1EIV0_9GAMM|nr:hypothetical protein [Legionella israelensis]QBR84732.1 hypothetical protein E3983_10395 [Legionella israelensis]
MAAALVEAPAGQRFIVHFKMPDNKVVKAWVSKEDAQTMEKMKKEGKLRNVELMEPVAGKSPKRYNNVLVPGL